MTELAPFRLDPVLVERPWGGSRLTDYGKTLPAGVSIGEKGVNRWFTKPIRPDLLVNEIDLQLVEPACAG